MEGVPRLYMIGLPAKRCVVDRKGDFVLALNHHIKQTYDQDPSLYSADIEALLGLRHSAMKAVMSSVCSVDDCTTLKRYYAHLIRITDKFPKLMQQQSVGIKESYDDGEIITTDGPAPPLTFTWKRALGGKINWEKQTKDIDTCALVTDSGDIGYEMRCVLYNLGAAHSRLASAQDRSPPLITSNMSTAEGEESSSNTALKIACTHLQCSAWAFQQLLGSSEANSEPTKWHHRQQPPVTSRAVLEFAYNVTLAQAQECILEKSMMDGRKPLIIAKVSAMICEYFAGAVNAVLKVEREPYCVSMNRIEKWRLYSEFKCRYYGAITALFQGQHVQDQLQQMGTRVSYYRRAVNLLGRAGQISENCGKAMTLISKDDDSADDDYYYYLDTKDGRKGSGRLAAAKELEMRRDSLAFSMDVAAAKWRAAKSENELIYHETVVPVLSDEDDSDCLGNNTFATSSSHRRQLERVKGASLVKPIGFSVDDPELLAVVIADNESSCTTTLFRDLVPTVTRNRAATYRTEKRALEAYTQSLCQEADDQLTAFSDTLNLECLEMYKNNSNEYDNDDNVKNELPQQLVNCCAAYQALLQQRQEQGDQSNSNAEDQLDIDMARLSSAVQVVDNMLDEIDRLLKTEELGDSEYRRTVGRPYDYSSGRMSELRREASRYREAHVGRARDSWVTLSRAVRDRRRRDLELLALPPDDLAAQLPPARPTLSAIASEVAAAGALDLSPSYNSAGESSDQNDDSESDDGSDGRLQQLQQESVTRMDRFNLVVEKMKEVREQRKTLLSRLRDDMDREDKDAAAAGQGDADILGGLRGSDVDISGAIKKKLDDRYGSMVKLIERNLSAQQNIMDAVREAYVLAAPERRAYSNAMQRRRTIVSSLLDAYESFMIANGGTPTETNSDMVTASPTSGLLPDAVLAERCTKGLDFYQRLLTNVSKLFQRVKGTCQVQTEQRNQIIKQHRQWETSTQQSDNETVSSIGGLDDLLAAVSAVDDQDHHQDDLAALIESFGNNVDLNKPPAPLGGGNWNQQHHLRRLSPLGSEQQQKQYYHHYSHPQIQPSSSSTFNTGGGGIDYYDYYYDNQQSSTIKSNGGHDSGLSTTQQRPASHSMHPVVTAEYNVTVGSTAVATPINSTTSPTLSSSMPYSYYNFQLPTASSAVNLSLSSPSYNSVTTIAGNSTGTSTKSMLNALHLRNNSGNFQNITTPYNQNSSSSSSYFPNAAAAIAALQRPLPSQYSVGSINNINNIPIGVGYNVNNDYDYNQATQVQSTRQQQFYSQHLQQQYQQQISTTPSMASGVTGVGSEGVFLEQRQSIACGGGVTSGVQSSLPLSSPSISSAAVNHGGLTTSTTNDNYFNQSLTQQQQLQLYQQQQQQQAQLYQQQQPQLYQQQPQLLQQQQSQMYKQIQQPQIYQQQQQPQQQQPQPQQHPQMYQQPQQPHLLTNLSKNAPGSLHYPPIQQPSQMYQPQQQLQSTTGLTTNTMITNQPQQPSLSNSSSDGNNYYQKLQQYQPQTTLASVAPLSTTTMALNNYYYQQPPMTTPPMTYNHQHQQQPQYYQQQQLPTASGGMAPITPNPTPVVNLLDDDLLLSGPPPIQPEKINISGGTENTTSTPTANNIK